MAHGARRRTQALGAMAALAIAAAASGDALAESALPAKAVIQIGGSSITRTTFEHWLTVAAATQDRGARRAIAYDPPDHARCVALKRRERSRAAAGRRATTAQLRTECRHEYEGLREQVLQFLILERWVAREARDRDIEVSAKEREADFQKQRKQSFPRQSDFRRYLRRVGMTIADARFQTAFNGLHAELRERAEADAEPVSDAEIATFYDEHPARFAEPETRDLRIVLTKTRAQAEAARAALQRGQAWRRVTRRYSIDGASRDRGGLLTRVVAGSQESVFDEALSRAPRGRLSGPVKTQSGFYVFKVLTITPARQQTLAQARSAIEHELTARRRRRAVERFDEDLRAKWLPRTTCRAGYVMSYCANAPVVPAKPADAR